jgi:PEP-CTERM motif
MMKKRVLLAALASLSLATAASASVVTLDPFTTAQSAMTTLFNPNVSNTQTPGDLFGPLGERELSATRIVGVGQVAASIGGGSFGCQRPQFTVSAYCVSSYEIEDAFSLSGVMYDAYSNGDPFGLGLGLVEFYKNSDLIGSQVLGLGAGSYSTVFASLVDFASGDAFSTVLRGTAGDDLRMSSLRSNAVPEPGSLALASLGLLGLGFLRRRSVA